ncbi:cation-translocating P-type ATPase [Salegentibacter salarius]|uniref:Cation-transporting P-type ATPase N-terminal domain-containing protein n=1 Tax=Salegentibacter salarius TaxID=435906 RepID=A0A2N0U0H9_9FLAO|nr:HAD-IC family P-type ATPase [Salegentibacter salarius]OEY73472.1 hypothetical protein BHS39_09165 [Salegentibacter salarius]PKD20510.1 hypothetical protein APR40_09155 [Salegentibacter salarius]SLJ96387.1 Ca2+-transporting ATPase [Salegentibacter salarius]
MDIDQKHPYHSLSQEETLEKVSAKEEGLSSDEAKKRQEKFGKNKLPEKGGTNPLLLILKQFKDFLIFILFIAAGVAWWADQMADVYIILAVILFNAIMGFTQEYKAEKAIQSIKEMQQKSALVLRDGKEKEIDVEDVVPGDIIILKEGRTIPADGRIIEINELRTSEASLTGESMPIDKELDPVEEDAPVGDRKNMAWKSTNVVNGKGKAVVTAIGNNTEIGKIAKSMGEMEMQDSNFKKKTNLLGKQMAVIAIGTAIIIFWLGYWVQDYEFQEILLVTIAVLVSTIPEGLPAVISIVLAIGANRMAKQNALIREFTATEMMGSVSVILVDKTGTLTQSILVIKKLFTGNDKEVAVTDNGYQLEGKFKENDRELNLEENPVEQKLIAIAAFCNDAGIKGEADDIETSKNSSPQEEKKEKKKEKASSETKEKQGKQKTGAPASKKEEEEEEEILFEEEEEQERNEDDQESEQGPEVTGDPTEAAMFVIGKKAKIKEREPYKNYKLLDDLPFKSEQKFRASLVETEKGPEIFTIGAPERILELSTQYLTPEGTKDLDNEKRKELQDKMDEWADGAMRVLALGYKKTEKESIDRQDVKDLVWVGITGIIDPPRKGVAESIKECNTAGIRVVMVTGDHKKTAAAIARDIGILKEREDAKDKEKYPPSITTKALDVDDEKFDEYIDNINVFARMNPDTKLRIAERLQAKETLIAMTGDGVNDAPALKRADVGIAMGVRGTDVAKDASEIVLQDDNFSSIVNAIREGRIVFNNVKITSYFLLTTNFAFAIAFIFGMSIGWPLLFTAAQILYVNLITDGIMDIALATEPGHGNIMKQPPVKKSEKILKWDIAPFIIIVSLVMVTLTLLTFWHYLPQGEVMARTAAFIVVSSTQLFNAYNMRSLRLSVFEIGVFGNRWVNIAFIAAIILQVIVVKIPFFQDLLRFEELPFLDICILILISSAILGAGELYKYLRFKKELF